MKAKVLATLLLLSLFLVSPARAGASWEAIASKVFASIGYVSMSALDTHSGQTLTGACSAFSIHENLRYWMTAAHCLGDDMKVDGQIATVIYKNDALDLMVLSVPGAPAPALAPSSVAIGRGTDIASAGHAYGFLLAMLKAGHVAHPALGIEGFSGTFLVLDFPIIGGMSGGPMVDWQGNVMAINQMANNQISLGRSIKDIMSVTAQFWSAHPR